MILQREFGSFDGFTNESFVTQAQLVKIIDRYDDLRHDIISIFEIDESISSVIQIGNAKFLINDLIQLDNKCNKIDIDVEMKNVHLKKMLEGEKAIFEIFSIDNEEILTHTFSDKLEVESRYSSKLEILDYYNFNKFANYCRDNGYFDLIDNINEYLNSKNTNNHDTKKLRLIYVYDDETYYLRALTSSNGYQDFGLNFSVFVALKALDNYVKSSKNEIFISDYFVDDSSLYASFALNQKIRVNEDLQLTFELILENDEIKRNAVSFNGMFKLIYSDGRRNSQLYIKPKGVKTEKIDRPIDLLTYQHRGKVENVFRKISELPALIDYFIEQVKDDAKRISSIESPDDIRKYLMFKVRFAQKDEFKKYKDDIYRKLMSISVDNTFKLFELLREVDELFESDDIISRNYWRTKLYETLIERK